MKRYLHNKSYYHLMTNRMGELTPVGAFETLAGDTVQIQNLATIRVSPPQTPVMHPVTIKFWNFFVPNRILDPVDRSFEWEKFITGGEAGDYVTAPPRATSVIVAKGSVAEKLGITPGTRNFNTFVMKAYAKCFNDYFRDQQLQSEIDIDTYDGSGKPLLAAWERDYFTQARPSDLLGPEVTLPLGTSAPVASTANQAITMGVLGGGSAGNMQIQPDKNLRASGVAPGSATDATILAGLEADLSAAGAINVNDLREAMAMQRYQEARNMYGARFTEYLRYLGISSSDARLQRPELISSGKSVINFSEVLNTTSQDSRPLGELGGHGIAGVRSRRARYFCEEHGHVITLMSARPKTIYQNTQHRQFDRTTKEDYWQKELQAIGMDEIYNSELDIDHSAPDEVFGFTHRYESFKKIQSRVSGDFRDTLNSWHLGRDATDLGTDPQLNEQFIACNPSDRIYSDTSDQNDKLWCIIRNRIAVRSMLRKSTQNFIL